MSSARLAAAGLPEFPLQILCLIRSQRQRVVVCAGGSQGNPALLGPCLNLVTWLGFEGPLGRLDLILPPSLCPEPQGKRARPVQQV